MDEKMMDAVEEGDFQFLEIDQDYEFDASRYFDFIRGESVPEAREAELWFETAGSCPPSPYIVKLHLREDVIVENVNVILEAKDVEHGNFVSNSDNITGSDFFETAENCTAPTFDNLAEDFPKAKTETGRAPFARSSTLMKPTASQLAKQNQSRFQKLMVLTNERRLGNPSRTESQAAKRQKLEGGHLHKVLDVKQETNLIHKVPKKDGNLDHPKLKITTPREPQLETAQRAQRRRPKNSMEAGGQSFTTASIFKAHRLNRKILEAPSMPLPCKSTPRLPEFQEFHLKTSERAMQNVSANSSSLLCFNNSDNALVNGIFKSVQNHALIPSRPQNLLRLKVADDQKKESEIIPQFKARPLNKKEFNFPTDKRFQDPPTDLFKKLSLMCECKQNISSQSNMSRPRTFKGTKENVANSLQQENKITHMGKETLELLGGKQIQCANGVAGIRSQGNICRTVGIR